MGIALDQSDTIHEDIHEKWCQHLKAEVDETVKAEVVKVEPAPVRYAEKLVISERELYIYLH